MLKLKLQNFGHLMWRADSFEKTLMLERLRAGGKGDDRGWDGWMASPTRCTWVWVDSGSWWWTGRPGVLWLMGSQRVGHDWATELNTGNHSRHVLFCFLLPILITATSVRPTALWGAGISTCLPHGPQHPDLMHSPYTLVEILFHCYYRRGLRMISCQGEWLRCRDALHFVRKYLWLKADFATGRYWWSLKNNDPAH